MWRRKERYCVKILHIVNPFIAPEGSEHEKAQPITYESMRRAKGFAKGKVKVELAATVYDADEMAVPREFRKAGLLTRTVQDVARFESKVRKLPLFKDILKNAYDLAVQLNCDYMIQTNIDICLMPHFYQSVARLIEMKYDALIINKRLVSSHYSKVEELPEMYCDMGRDHNGCDCFVFRTKLYPKFIMGNLCMGTPWSETALVANMVTFSEEVKFLRKPHLTFHIGDPRTWIPLADYRKFNTEEFGKVVQKLKILRPNLTKHHIIEYFIQKMKLEIQPGYSKDCQMLCEETALLF